MAQMLTLATSWLGNSQAHWICWLWFSWLVELQVIFWSRNVASNLFYGSKFECCANSASVSFVWHVLWSRCIRFRYNLSSMSNRKCWSGRFRWQFIHIRSRHVRCSTVGNSYSHCIGWWSICVSICIRKSISVWSRRIVFGCYSTSLSKVSRNVILSIASAFVKWIGCWTWANLRVRHIKAVSNRKTWFTLFSYVMILTT